MTKQPFWVVIAKHDAGNGTKSRIVCVQTTSEDADRVLGALRGQVDHWLKRTEPIRKRRKAQVEQWHATYGSKATEPAVVAQQYPTGGSAYISPSYMPQVTYSVGGGGFGPAVVTSMVVTGGAFYGSSGSYFTPPVQRRPPEIEQEAQATWKRQDEEELAAYRKLINTIGMMDRRFDWAANSLDVPEYEVVETSDDPHTEPEL